MNLNQWSKPQLITLREEVQCELARRNGITLSTDVPLHRTGTQAHVAAKFLPGCYVKAGSLGITLVTSAVFAGGWHYRCAHAGFNSHPEATLARITAPIDFSSWNDHQLSALLRDAMLALKTKAA